MVIFIDRKNTVPKDKEFYNNVAIALLTKIGYKKIQLN